MQDENMQRTRVRLDFVYSLFFFIYFSSNSFGANFSSQTHELSNSLIFLEE